jgi:outer membrane protein TolC
MRQIIFYFLVILTFSMPVFAKKAVTVGIVTDGSTLSTKRAIALIKKEVEVLTKGEFIVRFPKDKHLHGNWQKKGIETALDKLYRDPKVDIILVLGFSSAAISVTRKSHPKPTLVSTIIDSHLANAPLKGNTSGKHNLTYITIQADLETELKTFRKVVPFTSVALLSDALISEVMPKLRNGGTKVASKLGIKLIPIAHIGGDDTLISRIPKDVDAVIIGALPRMNKMQIVQLLNELTERGLPSYAMVSSHLVEQGALVSAMPVENWQQHARRLALDLQAVLLGENPKDMKVFINQHRRLIINMETARRLNISPSFKVMLEAEKLNETRKNGATHWTLNKIANKVLSENLSVHASKLNINIGEEQVNETESRLFPQLSLGVNQQYRKGDNSGTIAKQKGTASLSLSQILYDETSWANLDIEKLQQSTRIWTYKQTELDVVENATVAFLEVLKSNTLRDIRKDSIKLSRINLQLAQNRAKIGSATNSDIYRWESELANAQAELLTAKATLMRAEELLNQILNRPLDEHFSVDPATIDNPTLIMNDPELSDMIGNSASFKQLSKVLIDLGLDRSPEIATYISKIAMQKRTLKSERQSYWSPKITLNGEYSDTYHDSRVDNFSKEGENDWGLGLNLSLPLYEGGNKSHKVHRAKLTLHQLQLRLQDTKRTIEQKIRAALHTAQASKLSIDLKQTSAKASQKNFDLVLDAYSKGSAGIIELIDAQNSKIRAELNALNSTYQFLIDLMKLQRSIGGFDFFLDDDERRATVQEIKKNIILGE